MTIQVNAKNINGNSGCGMTTEKTVRMAKINDLYVIYDFCSEHEDSYADLKYLGFGFIHTINDVKQTGNLYYHFFKE